MKTKQTTKILFGKIYSMQDFDEVLRLGRARSKIARKGNEWFLLSSRSRVIGIYFSAESAERAYQNTRHYGPPLRLHNIERFNTGRCSYAESKEIFDSLKKELA